jgi:hypothetical protein
MLELTGVEMLEPLLGSLNAERVVLFVFARNQAYASEIASFYNTDLYGIQRQLEKFENGGVLVSKMVGRTRVYSFNPRYAFLKEIHLLLERALEYFSTEERERLLMIRRRPRRKGKPL